MNVGNDEDSRQKHAKPGTYRSRTFLQVGTDNKFLDANRSTRNTSASGGTGPGVPDHMCFIDLPGIHCVFPLITYSRSASCDVDTPEQRTIAEEMVKTKVSLSVLI